MHKKRKRFGELRFTFFPLCRELKRKEGHCEEMERKEKSREEKKKTRGSLRADKGATYRNMADGDEQKPQALFFFFLCVYPGGAAFDMGSIQPSIH